MLKNLKLLMVFGVVLGMLAGCSTNKPQEPIETETTEPEVSTEIEEVPEEPVEVEQVSADTVFYFEFDSAVLNSDARQALLIHAANLKSAPRSIRLEGHADERGTREYNMALGERRANAVRDFLVLQGVDSYNIETISYGEERAVDSGSYEGAWSKNRRVELN